MSAIAGIYHLNDEPINLEHGRTLMKELERYPANDVQIWNSDKVFLGCHAQWITPESVGEKLPYYDHERKLAITADAIIDNREELFERLQVDKRKRKEITDSELILLSYHKWGEESPKYLIGDFAFMIWDEKRQQFFGARDLSGYRTLYYYQNQLRFAFCTTIEPLLSLSYVDKQLNEQWLAEFLSISGMIDTLDALTTPYKNIEQLPPAHSILLAQGKIKLTRYGMFSTGERLKLKSNEEYVEAFQEVFQEAVNCRLRTHRKVGSQLSGGLDSGAVVGFAAKAMKEENKTLHTFSYIPPNDFIDFTPKQLMADERPFIKLTVEHVGGISDHYLDFERKNSYSEIHDMLEIMEMPYKFFENSFWLKGVFESAHKEGIGVLLNGDRGNFTISWGSALDYFGILLKRLKWIRLFEELNQYCKNVGGPRLRRLPAIARVGFPIIEQLFPKGTLYKRPSLINPEFAKRIGIMEKLKKHGIGQSGWFSPSNIYEGRRTLFEDIFPWNAGNTLTSKLSLKHSLWKRDPTNDIRVVRFCLSVPEEQYVQNGLDRALIRRATENLLPDKVRLNQRIRGVQGADWVHRMVPHWDKFINELEHLRTDKRAIEYLNGLVIEKALVMARQGARPELDTNPDYKILMQSLVVYRFIKEFS
ncbi:lasso peptide isopeptide bond-forming cyclase [Neobacillus sp. MM2021_6]|uniref:lasso peptide isopeptide bond-forming cyclase n=1 Tax=Bacillaceae TaxID=186817 RepID=UPI00140CCF43|nr:MULTISPECIES: lasso peptide isopeptide bond-forming cyclase [Bacillaceae]MBO0958866.1 lasso peptide isopeptide bond-forming cyclase [Neobacillus sp. MM2021_6]NHC17595.1 lasso peptide isopeptide bond-forming cyclase [Bacillus sp. MM2020_4]